MTYEKILRDLKNRIYHPVYFLYGDEPYYIDKISDFIEQHVLSESEKEFNQTVLYGKEVDVPTLISYAKRYPMMSNYQVLIVKEAQEVRNLIAKESKEEKNYLLDYLMHPQKSTLLVFCYKYKKIDKRTNAGKELIKHSLAFESPKLKDYKIPEWIEAYVRSKNFSIHTKAAALIAEYLGTDLSKIANELEKLFLNVPQGADIDLRLVESNIGISKDYNIFELQGALGKRNVLKANQIINYFGANPKTNPLVLTIPQLHSYFLKVLMVHRMPVNDRNEAAGALGISPYFLGDYETAARAYPEEKVISVISLLREYDMKSKGVNSPSMSESAILKELVYKILH